MERLRNDGWNLKAVIDLTFTSRYYSPKVCQVSTIVMATDYTSLFLRSLKVWECVIGRYLVLGERYQEMRSTQGKHGSSILKSNSSVTLKDRLYFHSFSQSLSDGLLTCNDNDVVAVHCTHGLNRTGYLVCR